MGPDCQGIVRPSEYIHTLLVATSVHIPKPLLAAVDRRARSLRISRNRLIVRALEREVQQEDWTPGFFDRLRALDDDARDAFHATMETVRAARRSKPPPSL